MARIGCVLVPLFPMAARLRSEPELLQEAVAIVEGNGNAARIIAATRRARKSGVRVGLSLPQARSILPKLIARGRDGDCERAAREALLEATERISPRVEDADEGTVYLDLDGLDRIYGVAGCDSAENSATSNQQPTSNQETEKRIGQALIAAVTAAGLPARVGIAASKLSARVAAELPDSPTIVPAGAEEAFLAPLPLGHLKLEEEFSITFRRWGIESIGDLARLPEKEIASRLGELGRELHFAARGIDLAPLIPRKPPPVFEEGLDLEWPLVALEPFLFVANAALDRLMQRLEHHGFACRRIELTLRLEPEGFHERGIDLPAPSRDVKTILALTRLDLEANPPGGAVIGFTFTAHPDRPRRAQLSLFGPPNLSPDKLATTIARIASMVGADHVGTPATIDGYRPERFDLRRFDPPAAPELRRSPRRARGLLAIRVFRPPISLEVIASGDSIRSIKSTGAIEFGGDVTVASGPWTLEEAWWSDAPVTRDYWDVELAGGGVYRVFRERLSRSWFSDGLYD